jgi:hypothetical protein
MYYLIIKNRALFGFSHIRYELIKHSLLIDCKQQETEIEPFCSIGREEKNIYIVFVFQIEKIINKRWTVKSQLFINEDLSSVRLIALNKHPRLLCFHFVLRRFLICIIRRDMHCIYLVASHSMSDTSRMGRYLKKWYVNGYDYRKRKEYYYLKRKKKKIYLFSFLLSPKKKRNLFLLKLSDLLHMLKIFPQDR